TASAPNQEQVIALIAIDIERQRLIRYVRSVPCCARRQQSGSTQNAVGVHLVQVHSFRIEVPCRAADDQLFAPVPTFEIANGDSLYRPQIRRRRHILPSLEPSLSIGKEYLHSVAQSL